MTAADAAAEIFITAFEALPRRQREAVLRRLLENPKLQEDIIDVSRWLARRKERAIPYDTVRKELKKAGRL